MKKCPRCQGKGYLKNEIVMNGICFKCDGYGDLEITKKVRAEKEAKNRIDRERGLKEIVAINYSNYKSAKFEFSKKNARERADEAFKMLQKEFNETMTLAEIEALAEEIKKRPQFHRSPLELERKGK